MRVTVPEPKGRDSLGVALHEGRGGVGGAGRMSPRDRGQLPGPGIYFPKGARSQGSSALKGSD